MMSWIKTRKMIDVCCAIIRNDEYEVLVVQRGPGTDHPLQWEFPGGKIEDGETVADSIIREIDEELAMDVIIIDEMPAVEYDYGFKKVRLFPLVCDTLSDEPQLSEHTAFRWLGSQELRDADLCGADIIIAEQYLRSYGQAAGRHMQEGEGITGTGIGESERQKIREMLSGRGGYAACDIMAEQMIESEMVMRLLFMYSMDSDRALAFRASYSISLAEEKVPGAAAPLYGQMAESLRRLKNESVIRSFLKVLNTVDPVVLDDDQRGIIADSCFTWLGSTGTSIAVKAYSMDALYRLSCIYPELVNELRSSVMSAMEKGSAGVKARGSQILKMLKP